MYDEGGNLNAYLGVSSLKAAHLRTGGTDQAAVNLAVVNHFAQAKLYGGADGCSLQVMTRAGAPGVDRGYGACLWDLGGGHGYVYFMKNGGNTAFHSDPDTAVSGDTVRMESVGSVHTIFVNGVQVLQVTDATYTGTNVGFCAYAGDYTADDFVSGAL